MIRCGIGKNHGVISHRNIAAMAVVVTVGVLSVAVQQQRPLRTYAMATTTTTISPYLSDSLQQSLPQLYDTPLKRIMDYTTDPITKSVTANVDTDDSLSLRSVVQEVTSTQLLPTVCFVVRRPG